MTPDNEKAASLPAKGDGLRNELRRLNSENTAEAGSASTTPRTPCILGVDPGLSGALAFWFPQHGRITADDMPTVAGDVDVASLVARIRQMGPDLAIIEIASSRPGQGVSSSFKFGRGYGAVIGVIAALAIPVHLVSATKWKRHFNLDADKERSRALALRLWPSRADLFGRKRDHNRAEAALLAKYAAERIIGGGP
jgi:hypothetical protein